jgi:hypothetical protein
MKTVYRLLVSSMILVLCLNISFAQDDEPPYPPITPENAQHLEMIQALSNAESYFQWSPDSTKLAVKGDDTWFYDVTDENLSSYHLAGYKLLHYAPNHDFYLSHDTTSGCSFRYCDKKFISMIQIHMKYATKYTTKYKLYFQIVHLLSDLVPMEIF